LFLVWRFSRLCSDSVRAEVLPEAGPIDPVVVQVEVLVVQVEVLHAETLMVRRQPDDVLLRHLVRKLISCLRKCALEIE
jgi:hypothetical protein